MLTQFAGKTVLITGASGFIGQHLLKRLQQVSEIKILALTRQNRSSFCPPFPLIQWLSAELSTLTPAFWQQHQISHIDFIFHLGAFTPKSTGEANDLATIYTANLQGTHALFNSLPSFPKHILFASTLDVYVPSPTELINEQSVLLPTSLYGSSKLFGEEIVKEYASHFNCGYSILRYGHIYGPGEEAYRKFIPETIRNLLAKKPPVIYGDGSILRDFLYIDDAIEATVRAALQTSQQLEPINIVHGKSVSLAEILQHLIKYTNSTVTPKYILESSSGWSWQFDNSLMKKILGHWPLMPLAEGLKWEVEYFQHLTV